MNPTAKRNLLHLLKIVMLPIMCVAFILWLTLMLIDLVLLMAGFEDINTASPLDNLGDWWAALP